jgi:hypothetical protein
VAPVVLGRPPDLTGSRPEVGGDAVSQPAPAVSRALLQRARGLFPNASPATRARSAATGAPSRPPDPYHPQPGDPPIIRRFLDGSPEADLTGGLPVSDQPPTDLSSTTEASKPTDQSQTKVDAETIESIIEAVEQRVLEELERRGLRYNPGVF